MLMVLAGQLILMNVADLFAAAERLRCQEAITIHAHRKVVDASLLSPTCPLAEANGKIGLQHVQSFRWQRRAPVQVLLFANGVANRGSMVERALRRAQTGHVLCADGGALNARRFGLSAQTIIGDLDSLSARQVDEFASAGAEILRFPAEKDETDLELALRWCLDNRAGEIVIIGALGGRIDQTLANICLLALPELREISIEVVDGEQSLRLLQSGRHEIEGRTGDTISLIPLGGSVHGLSANALQYPMRDETLFLGPARGISNVLIAERASIEIGSGMLLLIHSCGRA